MSQAEAPANQWPMTQQEWHDYAAELEWIKARGGGWQPPEPEEPPMSPEDEETLF